jgi:hypothetical protein
MKEGEIVVCSANDLYGGNQPQLIIGDQYQVTKIDRYDHSPFMSMLYVTHIKTGKKFIGYQQNFIPLSVFREYQLKKLDI